MLYSSSKPGVANFYPDCPQGVFRIWNFYPDFDTGIFLFFCLFYPVRAKAFLKNLPIPIRMRIRDLWVFSGVLLSSAWVDSSAGSQWWAYNTVSLGILPSGSDKPLYYWYYFPLLVIYQIALYIISILSSTYFQVCDAIVVLRNKHFSLYQR